MPKANWGVSASAIDDWEDRFAPYDGPIPPNGVYEFRVKFAKFVAATGTKNPQLRAGFELVPRRGRKDEKHFAGYFLPAYMTIMEEYPGFYTPFLRAIGVSGKDFEDRTIIDAEGNIKSIGKWRNTGDTIVKAEIKDDVDQNGVPRKKLNWFGPIGEEEPEADDDYDDEDGEEDYEDDDNWEDED